MTWHWALRACCLRQAARNLQPQGFATIIRQNSPTCIYTERIAAYTVMEGHRDNLHHIAFDLLIIGDL